MLIIHYLQRAILTPLAAICAILVVIFAGYSATRYLPDAVNGMMTGSTVVMLVFFKVLIALEVLIPVTLFFSVIAVLGRLHAQSEIIAMQACGLGDRILFSAVIRVSLLIAVLVSAFSLYARPWAYERSYWLKADSESNFDFARLSPGRFHEIGESGAVVFFEGVDQEQKRAEGIFIQQGDHATRKITHAAEAWQEIDAATGEKSLVLRNGYHYDLAPGKRKARLLRFENFRLPLVPREIETIGYRRKAAATGRLAASADAADRAEYQWRLSTGISTILLGLLGIPLGRTAPRRGRSARVFAGVIIFAIYYNLTAVAKTWMEQGVVGAFPGIWWPQVLLSSLLFILLVRPGARSHRH